MYLDDVPQVLQVGPAAALYYIERLRLADSLPVILEKRYVVAEYCPDLTAEDVGGSLYSLWTDRYHLPIEGADESIRAVNVTRRRCQVAETPRRCRRYVDPVGRPSDRKPPALVGAHPLPRRFL